MGSQRGSSAGIGSPPPPHGRLRGDLKVLGGGVAVQL